MKNQIIIGIMATTILIVGCDKKSPRRVVTPQPSQGSPSTSGAQLPQRAIVSRAKTVVLPEFKLDGVTLPEAIRQLQQAAKENAQDDKGFNFMISNPDVIRP